jgi:hypothetical protein
VSGLMRDAAITACQRLLPRPATANRSRSNYLRSAIWWLLEAAREYPSTERSLQYASNMLAAARALKPGESATWRELRDAGRVASAPPETRE